MVFPKYAAYTALHEDFHSIVYMRHFDIYQYIACFRKKSGPQINKLSRRWTAGDKY